MPAALASLLQVVVQRGADPNDLEQAGHPPVHLLLLKPPKLILDMKSSKFSLNSDPITTVTATALVAAVTSGSYAEAALLLR